VHPVSVGAFLFKYLLVSDDRPLMIEVRSADGQVVVDLSSSQGALRLEIPPADALSVAVAIKQAAAMAQASLAGNASPAAEMHHRR
jgi:hypothetical protein